MKTILPVALLVSLLPALAVAETVLDANEDGFVSFDELLAVYPEISTELFISVDSDGDALLSEEELAAAQDAGLIPLEES